MAVTVTLVIEVPIAGVNTGAVTDGAGVTVSVALVDVAAPSELVTTTLRTTDLELRVFI